MSYIHYTLSERICLQKLLSLGKSFREIAKILGRSPSTISREVKRNRAIYHPHHPSDNKYWYSAWRAQTLYIIRRRRKKYRIIKQGTDQWSYIVDGLNKYWSPEQICGRWKKDFPDKKPLHFSTIYRYIKRKEFPKITCKTHLRRKGKRMLPRNSNYNTIQPDRIIPEWPEEIKKRVRIGDWEGDTVYGGVGKGGLLTEVDRKTRCLKSILLKSKNSTETADAIITALHDMPVQSLSFDNGSEFAEFRRVEKELDAPIYFAEPHKPWQRGTNENTNDLLRFFFPKGFDFRTVTQEDVDFVVDLINNRPRKCLGYRTPNEVFEDELQKNVEAFMPRKLLDNE